MSRLYDNIKYICKANGVKLAEIEFPMKAGYISRHERRENILSLPLWILLKVSVCCNVSIDDLVNKDIASDAELNAVRAEIERLRARERELADDGCTTADSNYERQTDCGWK